LRPAQHVLWFDDAAARAVDVAGGKGANLAVLTDAGIPVPPGFIITTGAYRACLREAGIEAALAAALDGVDANDRASLERASAEAQRLILDAPMPSCADDVRAAYERLGGGLVAVRSSATAEDTADASFAGQQETHLNISGAGRVVDAMRSCWASLYEPRAIAYRAQCGIDSVGLAIAVVVQRMVQSERSGVAFSCDPLTHDHSVIVIEAVRGLGEALVSGAVTPDMYVVDKATMTVLERTAVEQNRELALGASDALDQTAWRDIPAVQRTRPKLSDEQIARLAEAVARVEHFYQAPQDIEWAYADHAFYVLQSRPITTLAHAHQ
jgi:pyruvate,water dikinase